MPGDFGLDRLKRPANFGRRVGLEVERFQVAGPAVEPEEDARFGFGRRLRVGGASAIATRSPSVKCPAPSGCRGVRTRGGCAVAPSKSLRSMICRELAAIEQAPDHVFEPGRASFGRTFSACDSPILSLRRRSARGRKRGDRTRPRSRPSFCPRRSVVQPAVAAVIFRLISSPLSRCSIAGRPPPPRLALARILARAAAENVERPRRRPRIDQARSPECRAARRRIAPARRSRRRSHRRALPAPAAGDRRANRTGRRPCSPRWSRLLRPYVSLCAMSRSVWRMS